MDFPKKQAQRLMPLYLLEYSEKLFENHPDPEAPWGGGGGSPIEAGTGIDITGDETKTISIDETVVATKTDLEDYVTGTSLTATLTPYAKINDSTQELVSKSYTGEYVTVTPGYGYIRTTYGPSDISMSIPRTPGYTLHIPQKDGTLAVTDDIPDVSEFVTETTLTAVLADYELKSEAFSGDYDDLTNKPDLSIYAESADLATVATSGSYNDLIDKPTIPSIPVTDVEVNGVSVLSGTVAEVTVPTDTSDLTNSAGFITSSAIPTNVSSFTNDANYVTSTSLTAELANYVPSSSITTVAYTGSYNDLTDKPSIPDANLYLIEITGSGTTGTVTTAQANKIQADPSKCILRCWTQTNSNPGYFRFYSNSGNNYYYMADLEVGSINVNGNRNLIKNRLQVNVSTEEVTLSQFRTTPISSSIILGSGLTQTISSSDARTISIDTSTVAMQSDLTDLVPASSLSTVAFSGSYTDLSDKPNIPVSTSDLTNDSGFITSSDLPTYAISETTDTAVSGVSSSTVSVINSATLTQATETLTFTYDDNTTASFTFLTSNTALTTGTTSAVSSVSASTITTVTGTTLTVS